MRTIVLLGALLMYGSAPVYAHKGVQRIANTVKGKVGQFVATGVVASTLLFTLPIGVEAGQYTEAARQAAIKTNRELAGEMQQLTNDILARHSSQLMPTQFLFPIPGLLDSLPASLRNLEVSKIKRGLRSLMTQIEAIEQQLEAMEDRGAIRIFDNASGLEHSEWHLHTVLLKAKNKRLRTKPRDTDQLLQYLSQQIDTVIAFSSLGQQPISERDKLKYAQQLGILKARTKLTLDAIEKIEHDKAKQRRHLWRFNRFSR